jgi:hypothetical protein
MATESKENAVDSAAAPRSEEAVDSDVVRLARVKHAWNGGDDFKSFEHKLSGGSHAADLVLQDTSLRGSPLSPSAVTVERALEAAESSLQKDLERSRNTDIEESSGFRNFSGKAGFQAPDAVPGAQPLARAMPRESDIAFESSDLLLDDDEYADDDFAHVGRPSRAGTKRVSAEHRVQSLIAPADTDAESEDDGDIPPPPPEERTPAGHDNNMPDDSLTIERPELEELRLDPEVVRERERQERMRAASAALKGQSLNADERSLMLLHRETIDEMNELLGHEYRLLAGPDDHKASPGGRAHTHLSRADMAKYVSSVDDILARKLLLIQDMMRHVDDYKITYGRQIGLVDPAESLDDSTPNVNESISVPATASADRKAMALGTAAHSHVNRTVGVSSSAVKSKGDGAHSAAVETSGHPAQSSPGLIVRTRAVML